MNIVVCGPAGTGKKKLIDEIRRKCKRQLKDATYEYILNVANRVLHDHCIHTRGDYMCDDRNYIDVQWDIIQGQYKEETGNERKNLITDNCVINALVLLEKCVGREVAEDFIKTKEVTYFAEKYKQSLVLFLWPTDYDYDDGKCLKISQALWLDLRDIYRRLFHIFHIPFLEIKTPDVKSRVDIVHDAIGGKVPLESSSLDNYNPKLKEEDRIAPSHFLFHLKKGEKENCVEIPTIEITEHYSKQDWTRYMNGETNRFIAKEGHEKLLCLKFDINVKATAVQKILLGGIFVNGHMFSFLGCSSNGLKSRKCFMWQGTNDDVKEILRRHGDFSNLKTVSKRLARIGLLFSGVTTTDVKVEDGNIIANDDITTRDGIFNFTDGCGAVGKRVAEQLTSAVCAHMLKQDYRPSVFQVRFQGYKGVLAVDQTFPDVAIVVRPSMKKFDSTAHPFIGVCGYSKPYTFGHLNKQFILLLSGLGIGDRVFQEKQDEHLETLKRMRIDSESAIYMLQWQNKFDLAQRINEAGGIEKLPKEVNTTVTKQLGKLQSSMVSKVEKLNIPIRESRNIFGICDPVGILEYGQCFLRLTISDQPKTVRGQVVVCKNPCYLLGDVRVLTAVDDTDNPNIRKLHHLVDCIVFPTRGKRPHSNEIAGSDLDGDQYFVTWDKELIPKSVRPPYDYPGADTPPTGTITDEKIIYYFSRQNETQKLIGRVDKFFNRWADLKGAKSTECERLGQLFSKVIDAGKTGEEVEIPKGLQPLEPANGNNETNLKYVWVKLRKRAQEFVEEFTMTKIVASDQSMTIDDISEDFVLDFAQRIYTNISEYEKFLFLWNYERRLGLSNEETLELFTEDFADFINFSVFSVEERKHAAEKGIPMKVLQNALNSSKVLTEDELEYFQMDSPLNAWKRYVILEHNNFDWSHLLKALTTNDNNLLVFRMPDDVVLELQILGTLETGVEQPVASGTITGILYSRQFGYIRKYILGDNYVLDLNKDTLQLYRDGKKNLTFVWLNATDRIRVKSHWNKRVCDEVRNVLSVDLLRFNRRIFHQPRKHPLINKTPFVMIELYAQRFDGEIPYWDIYDVNDNIPVVEQMEEELDNGSDFGIDFDSAFPKAEIDIEIASTEELCQRLREAAKCGNPYIYKAVLDKWLPRPIPKEAVYPFIDMFDNFVSMTISLTLPEDLTIQLSELFVMMSDILKAPFQLLSVVSMLHRLGLNELKSQLLKNPLAVVTDTEYIDVLGNWQSFVYLDTQSAILFVEQLLLSWIEMTDQNNDVTEERILLQRYVRKYGTLHLLHLLMEIQEHIREYERESERKDKPEKQKSIAFLKIDTTAEHEESVVYFYRTGALEHSASRFKGQYVMLSLQNPGNTYAEKQIICIGQLESLNTAPCAIAVKISENTPDIVLHSMRSEKILYWRIDLIGNIVMYERVVSAFKNIMSKSEIDEIFTHIIQPCDLDKFAVKDWEQGVGGDDFGDVCISPDDVLNLSQIQAVQSALTKKVCLIHGPPGTGKTEVACQIIRRIVDSKTCKGILAVAETNVAVDNLTRRLRNYVSVVRVGPVEGVEKDLYDVSLEGQVAIIAEREAKKTKIRDQQGNVHSNTRLINRVLAAADVVLTTCAGAGDIRLENYRFPFVLVDEGTQTLETTLLCSLTHGVKHLVMVGDPKQLGPVVKECPKECESPNLPDVVELSNTLFHKMYSRGEVPVCFLDVQHRMHPDIMKFPSTEFYEGKLKHAKSVEHRLPIVFPWPTHMPFCFVNVNGHEKKSGTSYSNPDEVDVVAKVLDVLLNVDEEAFRDNRIGTHQIGIITLYQGQVHQLKEKIKHSVKVSTVDGFQGQERDVIVVSTVRCNDRASLGFSDDPRRLNVLLTRAKRGLIVVGNKTTLKSSDIWTRWLTTAPHLPSEVIKPVNADMGKKKRR